MQTLKSKLITIAVLAILAVIGSLMGSHPVAAAGGPNVTIDGPLPLPVTSRDDPGRKAFAFFMNDSFSSEDSHNVSFTVPAGKRLVIESVSVNGLMTAGQKLVSTAVQARVNGQLEDYIMAPVFTGTSSGGRDIYIVSQQVTLYADGGTTVTVFATKNVIGPGGIMNASVQGHLIDCTAAACN